LGVGLVEDELGAVRRIRSNGEVGLSENYACGGNVGNIRNVGANGIEIVDVRDIRSEGT
jgi:hypothetical protein